MRKLRVDALVKTLEAVGSDHNLKARRIVFETSPSTANVQHVMAAEKAACQAALDVHAHQQFLLGPLANDVGECPRAMMEAESTDNLEAAVARLHATLETWIPPLEPYRTDRPR